MNVGRIKQLFLEFARALPEPGMPEDSEGGSPQFLRGPLLVRDKLIMRDELALAYVQTLDEMYGLASKDETWNKSALDDLLAKHIFAVATAEPDARSNVIKVQADELETTLKAQLTVWEMDLSVFGMADECAGLTFGQLAFMTDIVKSPFQIPGILDPGVNTRVLFARVQVQAIDRKSATDRARDIVEQHLAVLNALCSQLIPSRTNLAHSNAPLRRFTLYRAAPSSGPGFTPGEEPELRTGSVNPAVVLSRADFEAFLSRRGGTRMSNLLVRGGSFAGRLIAGFETAGAASVEARPHHSFLLFAIALESVVLGRNVQSEIKCQLSVRVAHLLSARVESRRTIAKAVVDLYDIRSKIVHAGSSDVSQADVESMGDLCLNALFALATLPVFAQMNDGKDLDEWFNDRMLGAIDPPKEETRF
jgi:hypothetical protein